VGAVGHRQLIRLLAFVVAFNMAVGVVAWSARRGGRHEVATAVLATGQIGIPVNSPSPGILAGANFKKQRHSSGTAAVPSTVAAAPITTAPSGSSLPTATQPASGGSAPARPAAEAGQPANSTTTSTRPLTSPASGPAASAGTATSTTTHPSATTAPPATTGTSSSAPGSAGGAMTDPVGDTVADGTHDSIKEPRADIVRADAEYRPGAIGFVMQVQQPTDPRQDQGWASDATFVSWSIDTDGDRKADYDLEYFVDGGRLGGTVSRPGKSGPEVVCDAAVADYSPAGYRVGIDPACLGNPASFTYLVTTYYDTNPKDENADVASDVTPNGGMSFPVARPN
jgi:hypothetical protein